MCRNCGCGEDKHKHRDGEHVHYREDGSAYVHHHHDHDGGHDHHDHAAVKKVDLELNILAGNDKIAAETRALLKSRGIFAVNLISSPGAGKTALLEKTLDMLENELPCAVIVGDQRSDADARRLRGRGAPVTQIETGSSCHLNAAQVAGVLAETLRPETKILFIENVGNLVCPAAFDLGEDCKIALLSAPEGEDKPLKYPSLFNIAAAVVITKIDLVPHLEWNMEECRDNIRNVNPSAAIMEVSARTEKGLKSWISYLKHGYNQIS